MTHRPLLAPEIADQDVDYGNVEHVPSDTGNDWIASLQTVLDEVTADLAALRPEAKELGGVALIGKIEGNVRPLVACTWLELTQVRAHSWLPTSSQTAWHDLLRTCELSALHVEYPQVAHHHAKGEPCNRGCRLVQPVFDHVASTQTTGQRAKG